MICATHRVQNLALFGSATGDRFRPGESDVDLVVEFQPMTPTAHADAYFGLIADLEALFGAEVELVERSAIANPHFLRALQQSEEQLFHAG